MNEAPVVIDKPTLNSLITACKALEQAYNSAATKMVITALLEEAKLVAADDDAS